MTVYSKIIGTGSYLPQQRVSNHDLAARLAAKGIETSDEWIVSRSGISARHYAAEGELASDMAVAAAKKALEMADLRGEQIDLIIVASSTPDFHGSFPSTACIVQRKLGIHNNCAAFDVQAVCSGFVYALSVADAFIKAGAHKHALVIGAEAFSRILNFEDRTTCVLFGDGAGAVVLKADSETGILSTHLHADGSKKELLWNPVGVSAGFKPEEPNNGIRINMKGNDVFKYAVKALDSVVDETLDANGLDKHDLDWLIPHQANLRIIEATAKRLDMSMDRVIVTVDRHGNTSSGSVPLALDEAVRSGRVQRGQLLLLEAFGGGFTWGSALLRY